jgi:hypothetical protein
MHAVQYLRSRSRPSGAILLANDVSQSYGEPFEVPEFIAADHPAWVRARGPGKPTAACE